MPNRTTAIQKWHELLDARRKSYTHAVCLQELAEAFDSLRACYIQRFSMLSGLDQWCTLSQEQSIAFPSDNEAFEVLDRQVRPYTALAVLRRSGRYGERWNVTFTEPSGEVATTGQVFYGECRYVARPEHSPCYTGRSHQTDGAYIFGYPAHVKDFNPEGPHFSFRADMFDIFIEVWNETISKNEHKCQALFESYGIERDEYDKPNRDSWVLTEPEGAEASLSEVQGPSDGAF
jgi:hypothetical protein